MVLVCPEGMGEVWSVWVGGLWLLGKPSALVVGNLLWELAALGEADHVFVGALGCLHGSRHSGRERANRTWWGLLCLGVPGCVLQASLCGCD